MKPTILQRYIVLETLRVALLAVLALTGIIFVGMAVELIQEGISIVQLRGLLPFVFAHSLPYALPASFLVASVFVFGRLSGHNEINAMRASGVNLNHIIWPLVLLAALVSAATFGLNHYLLPWSHNEVRNLTRSVIRSAIKHVGTSHTRFEQDNYLIYVGGMTPDRLYWTNVAVIEFARDYPAKILIARRGHCRVDDDEGVVILKLYDGEYFQPQLGQVPGEPVWHFQQIEQRINITGDDDVPPANLDRQERQLIETTVNRAVAHAGQPVKRFAKGGTVVFHADTLQSENMLRPALIEFNEEQLPSRLILAATAEKVRNEPGHTTSWRLLDGSSVPVQDTRLLKEQADSFDEMYYEFDAAAAGNVPSYGTNPAIMWFETRPKYLVLRDLLESRRVRKAKAMQLLALPSYAAIEHPKTHRKITEKSEGALYRKYMDETADLKPLRKSVEAIENRMEQTEQELISLGEEHRARSVLLAERETALEDHKVYSAALSEELKRLLEREASAEAITEQREKIEAADEQREALHDEVAALRKETKSLERRIARLDDTLEEQRAELAEARTLLDRQQARVTKAEKDYRDLRRYIEDVRLIEKWLRAETEFHYRNAGSTSTLVFILIGIPLGILSRRGNVLMAFAVSFFAVLIVYYPLMIIAQMMALDGFVNPMIAEWTPNILIGALGLGLLKWGVRR